MVPSCISLIYTGLSANIQWKNLWDVNMANVNTFALVRFTSYRNHSSSEHGHNKLNKPKPVNSVGVLSNGAIYCKDV